MPPDFSGSNKRARACLPAAILLLGLSPAVALDLDLGVASVSVGSRDGGLSVDANALGDRGVDVGVVAGGRNGVVDSDVSVGGGQGLAASADVLTRDSVADVTVRGGADSGTAPPPVGLRLGGRDALVRLEAATGGPEGIDLSAVLAGQPALATATTSVGGNGGLTLGAEAAGPRGLLTVRGTAAGIDISAGVLADDRLIGLCIGNCGGGSGSSGTSGTSGGSGVPDVDRPDNRPAGTAVRACDNGTGNSSVYNGFTVVDGTGAAIGTVHAATVGPDLQLTNVRFLARGPDGFGRGCVAVSDVTADAAAQVVRTRSTAQTINAALAAAGR